MSGSASGKSSTQRAIDEAKLQITRSEKVATEQARSDAFNRLSLVVIGTFCLCVLALFVYVIASSSLGMAWTDGFNAMFDLLKTVVVPLTSTVVGYYIASLRK